MNRISQFVDSFIPKNIPKKKAGVLKDELTCHIMDKAEFYREIGYDYTESVNKAIEDFGTDEADKSFIFKEFEELYSERSIWGIISFVVIGVMNLLCNDFGLYVATADYYRDPDPPSIFISFMLILLVLSIIFVARIKKYRKTLIATGVINVLICLSVLAAFYPQMASYAVSYNIIYLLSLDCGVIEYALPVATYRIVLLLPSLYCFIEAVRIRKGTAKDVSNPKKKAAIFCVIFIVIAIASSVLYPTSEKYVEESRKQHYSTITEEGQKYSEEVEMYISEVN